MGSSASALNSAIRTALESTTDRYFEWLLVCTAIVTAGVLLEGIFDSFPSGKCRIDNQTGIPRTAWGRIRWFHRLTRLGWYLVVLGVAGEGVTEYFVSASDANLRAFNNILARSTEKETALARSDAETAKATAKGFESQIADANRAAAEANLELSRIKSVRTLDSEQQRRIVARLTGFRGTPFVFGVTPEPEAINFMGIVGSTLIASGWTSAPALTRPGEGPVDTIGPLKAGIWYRTGLTVGFRAERRSALEKAADAVASAFKAEGFKVETGLIPDEGVLNPSAIHILVGSKR